MVPLAVAWVDWVEAQKTDHLQTGIFSSLPFPPFNIFGMHSSIPCLLLRDSLLPAGTSPTSLGFTCSDVVSSVLERAQAESDQLGFCPTEVCPKVQEKREKLASAQLVELQVRVAESTPSTQGLRLVLKR